MLDILWVRGPHNLLSFRKRQIKRAFHHLRDWLILNSSSHYKKWSQGSFFSNYKSIKKFQNSLRIKKSSKTIFEFQFELSEYASSQTNILQEPNIIPIKFKHCIIIPNFVLHNFFSCKNIIKIHTKFSHPILE